MTDAERQLIHEAITSTATALSSLSEVTEDNLIRLYDEAKLVHTEAIGIWCAVVEVMRARQGLQPPCRKSDAINLDELLREAGL